MLSRFIALRSFNGAAYSCRTIDFIALMAAMTLLLAHLDSRHPETQNLLAHQHHSDLAMIEEVKDNMEDFHRAGSDPLSSQISDWLARLLALEAETADDDELQCATTVSVRETGGPDEGSEDRGSVIVQLPCIGVLKIKRNRISRDVHSEQHKSQVAHENAGVSTETATVLDSGYKSGMRASSTSASRSYSGEHSETLQSPSPSTRGLNSLHSPQQGLDHYPELAATGDQWAFQGVDWAFFENLTRYAGLDAWDSGDAEWNMT